MLSTTDLAVKAILLLQKLYALTNTYFSFSVQVKSFFKAYDFNG